MRADLLVADRFQNITHGLRQLVERDDIFVVSQPQIKSDALSDVISQPPAGITSLVSSSRDRRLQPIPVELEELSRSCAQIWKFFFKGDHDFYLRARAGAHQRWNSFGLSQAETIPAEAHLVLFGAPEYEWHRQIDRHLGSVDKPTRNANRQLHRSPAVSRAPLRRSRMRELRVRPFRVRAQFRPPYSPT